MELYWARRVSNLSPEQLIQIESIVKTVLPRTESKDV